MIRSAFFDAFYLEPHLEVVGTKLQVGFSTRRGSSSNLEQFFKISSKSSEILFRDPLNALQVVGGFGEL